MKLSLQLLTLIFFPLATLANSIGRDNTIEWLTGSQNQPFLCGNDNCEILGERVESQDLTPIDAVIKYYPFEAFSERLTVEMETEFDAFVFVNTSENQSLACGKNPLKIPSQFGRIIWKDKQVTGKPVFIRTADQKITGVNPEAIKVIPGLDESFFDGRNALTPSVLDFLKDHQGQNYFAVSTGTIRNIARTMTPSGIFSVDFDYTNSFRYRTDSNPYEHMPNTILANARYGDNYQNRKFAFGIHGTPAVFVNCKKSFPNGLTINKDCPPCPVKADIDVSSLPASCVNTKGEKALGVKRDSAGCIRTYTPASKVIFNWAWKELRDPLVPILNPNINIPSEPLSTHRAPSMKILIIPFSGYEATQSCESI